MTSLKPDRFERMVKQIDICGACGINQWAVVKLLHRHHAAVVRIVKGEKYCGKLTFYQLGANDALDSVLELLTRYKKGGR
jgi:hypothetical protein